MDKTEIKRCVAFFDGQNLFYAAKDAFGYKYPNYYPTKLAGAIAGQKGWQLQGVRFYTGIHDEKNEPFLHYFWKTKLSAIGHERVVVYTRPLRYQTRLMRLYDGKVVEKPVGVEKGIDIRIALV